MNNYFYHLNLICICKGTEISASMHFAILQDLLVHCDQHQVMLIQRSANTYLFIPKMPLWSYSFCSTRWLRILARRAWSNGSVRSHQGLWHDPTQTRWYVSWWSRIPKRCIPCYLHYGHTLVTNVFSRFLLFIYNEDRNICC